MFINGILKYQLLIPTFTKRINTKYTMSTIDGSAVMRVNTISPENKPSKVAMAAIISNIQARTIIG